MTIEPLQAFLFPYRRLVSRASSKYSHEGTMSSINRIKVQSFKSDPNTSRKVKVDVLVVIRYRSPTHTRGRQIDRCNGARTHTMCAYVHSNLLVIRIDTNVYM